MNWRFWRKKPPVVQTQWGPVTEKYRKQAALNMAADHDLRQRVVDLLQKQMKDGTPEAALAEAKRRYPEAWQ
jgi:hypothetical protein